MKKLIITFLLVGAFLLRTEGWSQEVPGSTKKDISALKETAKSKLKSLGGGRSAEVAEDPLAMPSASPQMPEGTNGRRYSSAGKRDPFRIGTQTHQAKARKSFSPGAS